MLKERYRHCDHFSLHQQPSREGKIQGHRVSKIIFLNNRFLIFLKLLILEVLLRDKVSALANVNHDEVTSFSIDRFKWYRASLECVHQYLLTEHKVFSLALKEVCLPAQEVLIDSPRYGHLPRHIMAVSARIVQDRRLSDDIGRGNAPANLPACASEHLAA